MALILKADQSAELHPLSLANVAGTLYVVDGHHRLRAYKRAGRTEAPATVRPMTLREASHASKLSNVTHTRLEMRPEQKRNALWHYLAAVTSEGARELPAGETQRKLAAAFGQSRDTLQRMLARLPQVDPESFPKEHRDGITGWPHWRYVCETARNGLYQAMTPEQRGEWRREKYRRKLLALWDQFDPKEIAEAHKGLIEEARGCAEESRLADLDRAHAAVYAEDPF